MASRAISVILGAAVVAAILLPLGAVWSASDGLVRPRSEDWSAIWFTLYQASLSALLSVGLAVPVARALFRRRFWGRNGLILIMGAPFILPVIVAVLGLIAVFGQNGILNSLLGALGVKTVSIYGIQGILLAHVFFNLPLATRMILTGWSGIPAERLRLGQSLGLGPLASFRMIEAPMLRRVVPSALAIIFVICLSSFAVALTLGGGPRATTLELAIYQAVRFDFDLGTAASLGIIQLVVAGSAAVALAVIGVRTDFGRGLDRSLATVGDPTWRRVLDTGWIICAAGFLILPLGMVFWQGVLGLAALGPEVWTAAARSVMMALASTVLCLGLALGLMHKWGEVVGTLGIAVSPLVLGVGVFLIIRQVANPFDYALYVTLCVNALMALPFVVRILRPVAEDTGILYGPLAMSLEITGWAWVRWILLPRLARPLGFCAGLVAALAMGDLGVIALFGTAEHATLPLKLYQLMGAYRMDQAAAAACLLVCLSLGLFWVFDRIGRRYA